MKEPLITINNLWKSYGSIQVLKALSLSISLGETLVILGRSGVGKSVLIKHIIGLEQPDQGYVEVENQRITGLHTRELYDAIRKMGMLFQSGALFDSMSIKENTGFYLTQHIDHHTGKKLSPVEIKERVDEALSLVGLENTQNKTPAELSGGMKKRAALARLIAYKPSIILYDEPTTGLDPITSMQINELILKIQSELQATSIVITHDIRSASTIGDRIAFLNQGTIETVDETSSFLKSTNEEVRKFLQGYASL